MGRMKHEGRRMKEKEGKKDGAGWIKEKFSIFHPLFSVFFIKALSFFDISLLSDTIF